jgi:hypothetical protein
MSTLKTPRFSGCLLTSQRGNDHNNSNANDKTNTNTNNNINNNNK